MTSPDLDALEKLADEATPGEWTAYVSGAPEYKNVSHGIEIGPEGALVADFQREEDCAYVHAAQPVTIKALIAELKEGRRLVEQSIDLMTDEYEDTKAHQEHSRAFLARNGKGEGQ